MMTTLRNFREIKPSELNENPFTLLGSEWGLLAAGDEKRFNMMTIAWGSLGILWNKPVLFTFVRPTRHTFHFTERSNLFSLSFLGMGHRETLQFCGTASGKEVDKVKESGLTPCFDNGCPAFTEARLILFCEKIYLTDIIPDNMLDPSIEQNYPKKDYHRMYIGEIKKILVAEKS